DGRPAVETALVGLLDDPEVAVRVAALRALVAAPPSAALRRALETHDAKDLVATFGVDDRDYRLAETVVRLVQEGEGRWAVVKQDLGASERYVRQTTWDLLRRGLDLPRSAYDPLPSPGSDRWHAPDEGVILEALARRRTR
ncbi:MAG: hypothetical protein ACC662_07450, partial [Planctomycetota bacterium]